MLKRSQEEFNQGWGASNQPISSGCEELAEDALLQKNRQSMPGLRTGGESKSEEKTTLPLSAHL
ncbi:hypothetical protein SAMN02799630_05103 [Paenibacillus sp. UNCCL117]|uniref:hypothetical protein n=1 Tax=unclassified Paenibacillus TaxID=185978 RepID=UPI00088C4AC4|nr:MULTISPECIES: hypothetical protein [unclassified Paenibacillus]SDE29872.1 hypothetical protein SAMN04488602_12454 [Paenibacillus sp. cl123]SFW63177.1 hypothetical protein SAMN02799630_05103 [Paenibacillus sp. UNCCL117]